MKNNKSVIWSIIETPVIFFVVYSLLVLVLPVESWIGATFSSVISILVAFYVFGLVGYGVAKNNVEIKPSKAGAYSGAVMGLASAVVGVVSYYIYPEKIAQVIQAAVKKGVDAGTIQTVIQIGIYVNLLIDPIIYALIGAFLSWLAFLIFRKRFAHSRRK